MMQTSFPAIFPPEPGREALRASRSLKAQDKLRQQSTTIRH